MNDVATYDANIDGDMVRVGEGEFVTIQDYRYMERKYLECKAELEAVKAQRDALVETINRLRSRRGKISGASISAVILDDKAIEQAEQRDTDDCCCVELGSQCPACDDDE